MPKSQDIVSKQHSNEVEILRESLDQSQKMVEKVSWEHERLQERLSGLDLALDNIGWSEAWGYADDGPSLNQIHSMSKQLRPLMGKNSHIKQGWMLRFGYVWDGGVHYSNIPGQPVSGKPTPIKRGPKPKDAEAWARVQHPINQKNFFSSTAHQKREGMCYGDGHHFFIGEEPSFTLRPLPIGSITADYRNPEEPDEVWAYRRSWMEYPTTGNPVERSEWIFHNLFKENETASISYNGKSETVATDKRIFGSPVNGLPGWAYGIPDAFAGMNWSRQYRDVLLNGKTMTDALASIAYKVINKSTAGATNAGVKIAGAEGGGNVANMIQGQDMLPMGTAGKGYDFDAARPILAAFAASIGVSVVAVAADPGAAGSSYGSAQTLDLPTRLMAEARRMFHIEMEKEVLAWFGAPDAEVWFDPIEDYSEILRAMQFLIVKWNTGLYSAEDMKADIEGFFGRVSLGNIPEGVLVPNNANSWERSDIDPKEAPGATANAGAAPGQGQSTGTGDIGTNNDQRSDTIS